MVWCGYGAKSLDAERLKGGLLFGTVFVKPRAYKNYVDLVMPRTRKIKWLVPQFLPTSFPSTLRQKDMKACVASCDSVHCGDIIVDSIPWYISQKYRV